MHHNVIYKPLANGLANEGDSCGRLNPGQDLPPFLVMMMMTMLQMLMMMIHDENYQDGVVVGMSMMGDGGKRSTTSSTGSHLVIRRVRSYKIRMEEHGLMTMLKF